MKKNLKIFIVIFMIFIFLTGLAFSKTTITWWINPWRITPPGFPADQTADSEAFPKWVSEEFMKLHPDVEVKYVVVGNTEYSQKMAAAIATGTNPDIFKGPVWDSRWAKAGLLEPIDEYLTDEDLADYYEVALEEGEIDGEHYIWPWNLGTNGMGTTMLLYTPDFEKAGIDWQKIVEEGWTVEEFLDTCDKLTWDEDGDGKTDHYAISFGAKDTNIHNVMNFLYTFGGKLTNEDETVVTFNDEGAVAGLQFVVDLVDKYGYAPRGVEGLGVYDEIGNFHSHRTSIGFGGPYEINRITRYVNSGQLAEKFYPVIAPFPHLEGEDPAAYSSAGGFVTFKQDDPEKKELVFEFVQFLTNAENTALLETLNYLTARKSVNEILYQDDPYRNEQAAAFAEIIGEYGVPFFGSQEFPWSQISKYFTSALQGAFGGTKTPQEALDYFVEESNKVIERMK